MPQLYGNVRERNADCARDVQRVSLDIANWDSAPKNALFHSLFLMYK